MAAFTSKASGGWDQAGQTTWKEVGTPGAGDTVTIQNIHTVFLESNTTCTSLQIDAGGTFDTTDGTDWDFTTTGVIAGGSAGGSVLCQGTFNANSSTLSILDGGTAGYGLNCNNASSDFNGGSGTHTMGSLRYTAGNVTATSGNTILNGLYGATILLEHSNWDDADGTITFARDGIMILFANNTLRTFYNVVIDGGASTVLRQHNSLGMPLQIDNNFTITTGEYNTPVDVSVTNNTLIEASGTLTIELGSTFTCCNVTNNGTFTIDGTWSCGAVNFPGRIIDAKNKIDVFFQDVSNIIDGVFT